MNSTIDNTLSQVLSIVEFLKVKKVILIFYDSGWVESTHYSSLFGLSNFSFRFKGQIPYIQIISGCRLSSVNFSHLLERLSDDVVLKFPLVTTTRQYIEQS